MKKAEDEGFVRRWSRLKSEARRTPAEPRDEGLRPPPASAEAPALRPEPASTVVPGDARGREPDDGGDPARFDPASLPDIESLTFDSDYTAFLQEGVPRELRNRALQRLWRSDPVLANLDGLLEYGEDYSAIGTKKTLVRTAYRVGRGMIDRALEPEKETREPEAPVAPGGAGEAAGVREPPAAARPGEPERAEAPAETDEAPGPGPRRSET
jgi:Protein of unknown function (DUF3306)